MLLLLLLLPEVSPALAGHEGRNQPISKGDTWGGEFAQSGAFQKKRFEKQSLVTVTRLGLLDVMYLPL